MLSFQSLYGLWHRISEPAYRFPKVSGWPFTNPEPHIAYMAMIHGLIEVDGPHVLMPETSGPVGIRNARRYIWWASGRLYPNTNPGINNTCGHKRCISWNHLALVTPAEKQPKPQKPQPPQPKPAAKKQKPEPPRYADRTKCMTAKIWYPSKTAAQKAVREIRETCGGKQYAYECDMYCGGYHLTSIKPGKFNPKKVGAW